MKPKLVLAVTTFDRVDRLSHCLNSWYATKSDADWTLIIADDGSGDGTVGYIKQLNFQGVKTIPVFNTRVGVHHQTNDIFRVLKTVDYDFAFKIDDDVEFVQKGWDNLYRGVAQRSGFDHLVFFDERWYMNSNIKFTPGFIVKDGLQSWAERKTFEFVQGAFWTVTPRVLDAVGYFDEARFGWCGGGHKDFTLRCCCKGFNEIPRIWDAAGSHIYLRLVLKDYKPAVSYAKRRAANPKSVADFKNSIHALSCSGTRQDVFLDLPDAHKLEKHPEAGLS